MALPPSPRLFLLFAGLSGLAPGSAPAAAILGVQANVTQTTFGQSGPVCFNLTTGICSGSRNVFTPQDAAVQWNYQSTAVADYGVLKVNATQSFSAVSTNIPPLMGTSFYVQSVARFRDGFTVAPAVGAALSVANTNTLTLIFNITGDFGATPGSTAQLVLNGSVLGGGGGSAGQTLTAPGLATLVLAYDPRQASDISIEMAAVAQTNTDPVTAGMFARADASHTAVLTNVILANASGQELPFTLVTESGSANYASVTLGSGPAAVPEPSTLALAAGALAVLAARRRQG